MLLQIIEDVRQGNFAKLIFAAAAYYLCRFLIKKWSSEEPRGDVRLVPRGRMPLQAEPELDYKEIEPEQYRPFKPEYHMTMGLMKTSFQDWLRLDKNYPAHVAYRANIVKQHYDDVCLVNDDKEDKTTSGAVFELYDLVVGYLVTKYPQYFVKKGKTVHNLITESEFPADAAGSKKNAKELLAILSSQVEEDFLLLNLDEKSDEYVLRAATFIAPSGFVPAQKLNKQLTDIHGPVPMYEDKLKTSMNKYFKKIELGQLIQRLTWTVQNTAETYTPSGTHASATEKVKPLKKKDLDFEKTLNLRVERQMLSRLAHSRYLLFTVRTYTYPLADVKKDGSGPAMIQTIKSFPANVAQYKRRAAWGPAVTEYLST